jgi:hypothetical protein
MGSDRLAAKRRGTPVATERERAQCAFWDDNGGRGASERRCRDAVLDGPVAPTRLHDKYNGRDSSEGDRADRVAERQTAQLCSS